MSRALSGVRPGLLHGSARIGAGGLLHAWTFAYVHPLGVALSLLISVNCAPPPAPTTDETPFADARHPQPVPRTVLEETVGQDSSVSANGRFFSLTDWSTGDLVLRDLTTGEDRRITDKGSWYDAYEFARLSVPSPDGSCVAYNWFNSDGTFEVRLVGLEGADPTVLHQEGLSPLAWSPDGRTLAAAVPDGAGTRQIMLTTVNDGSQRVLTTVDERSAGRLSFARDGRYLAYDARRHDEAPDRDIFVISIDGSQTGLVVDHPADDFLLGWSAEGGELLFASDRRGTLDRIDDHSTHAGGEARADAGHPARVAECGRGVQRRGGLDARAEGRARRAGL